MWLCPFQIEDARTDEYIELDADRADGPRFRVPSNYTVGRRRLSFRSWLAKYYSLSPIDHGDLRNILVVIRTFVGVCSFIYRN